jgi:hypothetical protein
MSSPSSEEPPSGGIGRDLHDGLNEVLLSVDFGTLLTEEAPEVLRGKSIVEDTG